MILIADSGSTKASWSLIENGNIRIAFSSEGYNPCYMKKEAITNSLKEQLPEDHDWAQVKEIAFYGAGCYEDKFAIIQEAMRPLFPQANVSVAMDLLGSARALLCHQSGFAAILGTGTNSCLYDGNDITHNVDSLGFMLGDEGSGGYIGKRLISDFIRGYMPEYLRQAFFGKYQMTGDDLIDKIYSGEMPNRFCASFTRFISDYGQKDEYLDAVVHEAFTDFFKNIVCGYPSYSDYTFNCVGSIGYVFKDTLIRVADEFGMKTGRIIREPMEGLIEYHSS